MCILHVAVTTCLFEGWMDYGDCSLDGMNHKWTATQGMCTTNNSATPRTTAFLGGNQRHSAH